MIAAAFLIDPPEEVRIAGLSLVSPAFIPGTIYDDGGTPRLCLGLPGSAAGHVYLIDHGNRDELLQTLDIWHGIPGSAYIRTIAMTNIGPAHTWHWTGPVDLDRISED